MGWRTVVVTSHAKLDLQSGFLMVRNEDGVKRVLLDELDLLLIENPAVALTGVLVAELCERKINVIFCDRSRNPIGMVHSFFGCHDATGKLREQLQWRAEAKIGVWNAIVKEKINNQAQLLKRNGRLFSAGQLELLKEEVLGDDITNREGHAAKMYFCALFGEDFARRKNMEINKALNYGYMVMLGVFNRALISQGYLTQLGINHCNVHNPFNLSCDLIEPFRVVVDEIVLKMMEEGDFEFDKNCKRGLLSALYQEYRIGENKHALPDAIAIYVRSICAALSNNDISKIVFANLC